MTCALLGARNKWPTRRSRLFLLLVITCSIYQLTSANNQDPLNANASTSNVLLVKWPNSTSSRQLNKFAYDLGLLAAKKQAKRRHLQTTTIKPSGHIQKPTPSNLIPETVTILNPTQFDDDNEYDVDFQANSTGLEDLARPDYERLVVRGAKQQRPKVRLNAKFLYSKPQKAPRESITVTSSNLDHLQYKNDDFLAPLLLSNDVKVQSPTIMVRNDSAGADLFGMPVKTLSQKVELAPHRRLGAGDDQDDYDQDNQSYQLVNEMASITPNQDNHIESDDALAKSRYSFVQPSQRQTGGSITILPYEEALDIRPELAVALPDEDDPLASSSSSSLLDKLANNRTLPDTKQVERKFGQQHLESSASSGIRVTIGKTSRPLVMNNRGLIVAAKANHNPHKLFTGGKYNFSSVLLPPNPSKPSKRPLKVTTTSTGKPQFNPAKLFATSQQNHQLDPLEPNKPPAQSFGGLIKVQQFPSTTLIIKRPHQHGSTTNSHLWKQKIPSKRPSETSTNLISSNYDDDQVQDDGQFNGNPKRNITTSEEHKLIRIKQSRPPTKPSVTSTAAPPPSTTLTALSTTTSTTTLNPLAESMDEPHQHQANHTAQDQADRFNSSSSWFFTHNPPYKQNLPADMTLTTQPMTLVTSTPPVQTNVTSSQTRPNDRFQPASGDKVRRPTSGQSLPSLAQSGTTNSKKNSTSNHTYPASITYSPPYETTLLPSESTINSVVHSSSNYSLAGPQPPLNTHHAGSFSKPANKLKNKLSSLLIGKIMHKAQHQPQTIPTTTSQQATSTPMAPVATTTSMMVASTEAPAPLLSTAVANNVASLLAQKLNSLVVRPNHHHHNNHHSAGSHSLFGFRVGPSPNPNNQFQSPTNKFKLRVNPFAGSLNSHSPTSSIINRRTTGVGSLLVSGLIYGLSVLPALMALTGVNPLASSGSPDEPTVGASESILASTNKSPVSRVRASDRTRLKKHRRHPIQVPGGPLMAGSESVFPAYLVPLISAAASAAAANDNNNANSDGHHDPIGADGPVAGPLSSQFPPEPQSTALKSLYAPPPTVIDSNSLLSSEAALSSFLDEDQRQTAALRNHHLHGDWQPSASSQNHHHHQQDSLEWGAPHMEPTQFNHNQELGGRKHRDLSLLGGRGQNYDLQSNDWRHPQRNQGNQQQNYLNNKQPERQVSDNQQAKLNSSPGTSFDDRLSFGGSNHQPIQSVTATRANLPQFGPIVSQMPATSGGHRQQAANQAASQVAGAPNSMSPQAPPTTMPPFVVRTDQFGRNNFNENQPAAGPMAPNQYNSQRNDLNSNSNNNFNSNGRRNPLDPIELYPNNNQVHGQAHQTSPIVVGSTLQVAREQHQRQQQQMSSLPGSQDDPQQQQLAILSPLNPIDEEQITKVLDLNGARQRRTILSTPSPWSAQLSGQNPIGSSQLAEQQRFGNNNNENNLVRPPVWSLSSSPPPDQHPSLPLGDSFGGQPASVRKLSPQSSASASEWRAVGPPANFSPPRTPVNQPASSSSSSPWSSSDNYFAGFQHQHRAGARRESSGEQQSGNNNLPKQQISGHKTSGKGKTKNKSKRRHHFRSPLTLTRGNKNDDTITSPTTTTSSSTTTTRRPGFSVDDNDGESELLLSHSMALGSRVLNEPLVGHHD